jgi:hypothetical protein
MTAYRTTESCPRCQSVVTTSDGTCRTCGHVWGSGHRCVHCGVSCAVTSDPRLGPTCSRCGLPRIAGDWEMPGSTALGIRRAVAQRRVKGQVATLALLVAVACMPLGVIAAHYAGFAGWFAVLLAWFASVAVAGSLRAGGRRSMSTQVERARREWEASTRRVRIEVPLLTKPEPGDVGLDDELADGSSAARRASLPDIR